MIINDFCNGIYIIYIKYLYKENKYTFLHAAN